MAYNFEFLSPADLEDLARDLIGRKIGVRFEAFASGPDGGMDGRHARAGDLVILQVKHFAGSPYRRLRSQIKQELPTVLRLSPTRYLLATSRPLSPRNKAELASLLRGLLRDEGDIFGPKDLNALLREFQDIEKSHIKLWLSGAAMLESILRAANRSIRAMTMKEIEFKVRVYV